MHVLCVYLYFLLFTHECFSLCRGLSDAFSSQVYSFVFLLSPCASFLTSSLVGEFADGRVHHKHGLALL